MPYGTGLPSRAFASQYVGQDGILRGVVNPALLLVNGVGQDSVERVRACDSSDPNCIPAPLRRALNFDDSVWTVAPESSHLFRERIRMARL
jgi:hypothetical protein